MGVNKVVYDGNTLIDLSGDTLVSPEQLVKGVTAHGANGNIIVGTFDVSAELDAQDALIDELREALENKAGGTKLIAAIGVTYPEGSILTCTNGTETFTAETTSGKWVFAIPELGEWTVTSTDPANVQNTKSTIIDIDTEGLCANIMLEYLDYVIHNGVLRDNFTINTTTATYEVVDGALVFKSTKASSGNGNIIIDANGQDIDLSNRTVLKFDTEAISPRSGTLDFVRWSVSGTSSVQKHLGVDNPVERQIVSIDISNISNGSINMFISDNPATVELKIYDAWFE